MASALRFACVGDVTIDRFHGRHRSERIGGNALNVACWIAYLGGGAWLYSAVGEDREGRAIAEFLDRSGVRTEGLITLAGDTPWTDLSVGDDGDRSIVGESYGTAGDYRPAHAPGLPSRGFDVAHIGYSPVPGQWRASLAGNVGTLAQDCAVSHGESDLQIAFHSRSGDLDAVRREFAGATVQGAPVQIVTCGASGALGWAGGQEAYHAAVPADVVDTTGAGDAFMAGFLYSWATVPADLPLALAAGARLAAQCCARAGGTPLDGQIG
ncbi:MAG: PfkB family carbohydrate kinase [Beutenbergiaceae bacterium]